MSKDEAVRVALTLAKRITSSTPRFGHTATLKTVSGTVLIEQPGSGTFVPLSALTSVPLGTTIDTSKGTVQLASAKSTHGGTQTGQFYGGVFKVTQAKARSQLRGGRSVGITDLSLTGGVPSGCAASSTSANIAASHTVRRLWGNGHGNFRTTGRYASATVRGTKWLTEDTCQGTLVKVSRGVVAVEDLRTHRTTLVRAGHSLLSGAGAASATAPCTKSAIAAGLAYLSSLDSIDGIGCAGRFAYAFATVGTGQAMVGITVLLRAEAGAWKAVSREKYCTGGQVPARIRRPACESN